MLSPIYEATIQCHKPVDQHTHNNYWHAIMKL